MWLLNSSIGRKLIMSLSGLFLILFLLFHLCMNIAAVFSGEAYNMVCELLGTNWYALVGTLVLAAGVVIHFVYAIMLTLQNRRARGNGASERRGMGFAEHVRAGRDRDSGFGSAFEPFLGKHDVCGVGRYSWGYRSDGWRCFH